MTQVATAKTSLRERAAEALARHEADKHAAATAVLERLERESRERLIAFLLSELDIAVAADEIKMRPSKTPSSNPRPYVDVDDVTFTASEQGGLSVVFKCKSCEAVRMSPQIKDIVQLGRVLEHPERGMPNSPCDCRNPREWVTGGVVPS